MVDDADLDFFSGAGTFDVELAALLTLECSIDGNGSCGFGSGLNFDWLGEGPLAPVGDGGFRVTYSFDRAVPTVAEPGTLALLGLGLLGLASLRRRLL
ncbi:PEP-CTERM sorting domain-containing protein [Denitrobaculum tricleocarpae]|uniref:PEP-CTERM sorting domain-containing protein n=1 Tax=Denitrobaculum tricleocarpae TaxID=2591009 RepID=A0A545TS02_9PROT|nr:PEP-CTERM sorting domain-containing protein [Denitrobaculum tricleocarpae]